MMAFGLAGAILNLRTVMSPHLLTLYALTFAMCERLMADISQEEMELQAAKSVNS